MSIFSPIDFGELVPGASALIATGTTVDTGFILIKKVNVFASVLPGAVAVLPSSYAPGSEILTMNRGGNSLNVAPSPGDQIEFNGIDVPLNVPTGWNLTLVSFDPPAANRPRTWWIVSLLSIGLFPGNLFNNGGVLSLTDSSGWPTSSTGLLPGQLWSNGGVVSVMPGSIPNPSAPPVFFGLITAVGLLALGGFNLPTSAPLAGSGQLWNSGGEIWVA